MGKRCPCKFKMLVRNFYSLSLSYSKVKRYFLFGFHTVGSEIRVVDLTYVRLDIQTANPSLLTDFAGQSLNLIFALFFMTLRESPKTPPIP